MESQEGCPSLSILPFFHVVPQESLEDSLRFEWTRLLNESSPSSFVTCTGGGRAGVVEMLGSFGSEGALPIYASANMTCYMVYASPQSALNVTYSLPQVRWKCFCGWPHESAGVKGGVREIGRAHV